MGVRLVAFARLRELLGDGSQQLELSAGSTAESVWQSLVARVPALAELGASTRFAVNGQFVDGAVELGDGDELALLPPVGGG